MSITTRSSDASETDCDTKYRSRQHPYNTRYSKRNSNARQAFTTKKTNKLQATQCLPTYNSNSERGDYPTLAEEDDSSMDYCYDPCPTPPRRNRRSSLCSFFKGTFYIVLIGSMLWIGHSQYNMNNEVKQLKNEVQKIRGGNRKEDPHAKLSKELDKKCSDTLKLLLKDPVGRPDFALESSGGRVISVESEAYTSPKTFLGFSLCEGEHGPSSMIQATTSPGECWAFKGHTGKAVLQLIDHVLIDSVTVEHIPHTISPSGNIDTAPKDFKIWGLDQPKGNKRLLGQFTYEKDGGTVQTFSINNEKEYYKYVEFEVLSNHGNKDFTCVYRVRVHGTVQNNTS